MVFGGAAKKEEGVDGAVESVVARQVVDRREDNKSDKKEKKMFFGQNVKKQDKVKESTFMDEFMRTLDQPKEAESNKVVLQEKIALVKLMADNRTKFHHLMTLHLELNQI